MALPPAVCIVGIIICGLAGRRKEGELSDEEKKASIGEFALAYGGYGMDGTAGPDPFDNHYRIRKQTWYDCGTLIWRKDMS